MMNAVLKSSNYRGFAQEHLATVVIDLMEPGSLAADTLDYRERLKSKYGVSSFPTSFVLAEDGAEILRIEGYDGKGPHRFVERLKTGMGSGNGP